MTRKKNDNVLGLAPLTSDFSTTSASLVPWSSGWPLIKDEARLIEEARKQRLAIAIIDSKARFGASRIGEIHQHASRTFDEATSFIKEIEGRSGRSQQHQAVIKQYSERQIQLLAQHSLAVTEVSAADIGMEIHRSPYPSLKPERRIGFLQRLLGDGQE